MDTSLKDANGGALNLESAKALYSLVGVLVHEGNTIQGGHYISYVKKYGQWYRTDDLRVTKVSPFEATHQQAYLLFYQKVQAIKKPKTPQIESIETSCTSRRPNEAVCH